MAWIHREVFGGKLIADFLVLDGLFLQVLVDGLHGVVDILFQQAQKLRVFPYFSLKVADALHAFLGEGGRKSLACHENARSQVLDEPLVRGIVLRQEVVAPHSVEALLTAGGSHDGAVYVVGFFYGCLTAAAAFPVGQAADGDLVFLFVILGILQHHDALVADSRRLGDGLGGGIGLIQDFFLVGHSADEFGTVQIVRHDYPVPGLD